jgi:hypothetical protein
MPRILPEQDGHAWTGRPCHFRANARRRSCRPLDRASQVPDSPASRPACSFAEAPPDGLVERRRDAFCPVIVAGMATSRSSSRRFLDLHTIEGPRTPYDRSQPRGRTVRHRPAPRGRTVTWFVRGISRSVAIRRAAASAPRSST